MKAPVARALAAVAVVGVIAAVVAGLLAVGSPGEERARRGDRRRVQDLRGVMAALDLYWTRHERLPESLDALVREPGLNLRTADPVTGEAYAYTPGGDATYELCATFERESADGGRRPPGDLLAHGPGRQCFELEAVRVERGGRVRR